MPRIHIKLKSPLPDDLDINKILTPRGTLSLIEHCTEIMNKINAHGLVILGQGRHLYFPDEANCEEMMKSGKEVLHVSMNKDEIEDYVTLCYNPKAKDEFMYRPVIPSDELKRKYRGTP